MSEGCPLCGVRGDVGCKHQPASGFPPPAINDSAPKKKRAGNLNSPWGAKGNPAGPAAQRIKDGLQKMLKP